MGLRWLNGHAVTNEAGKTQRLIVEFAIENAQVVARRKDLQVRSLANQTNNKPAAADEVKTNPKFLPKGKDFSVSKGKWQKQTGKGKPVDSEKKAASKNAPTKENLQQTLIARKRMTRKKKANARG
jgi:nucleolar protein 4